MGDEELAEDEHWEREQATPQRFKGSRHKAAAKRQLARKKANPAARKRRGNKRHG